MRHAPLAAFLLLSGSVMAADAKPETKPADATTKPTSSEQAVPAVRQPDPTAAIVAEGRYLYRQRDIDALMLIAARHAKARFAKPELDKLREALTTAMLAREPLMDALSALPGGFSGPERDALVLDLLDYQAEPAKAPAPVSAPANNPATPANAPVSTTATAPATAPVQPHDSKGPLLIRLPPLNLVRTLPGTGKRHLSLTIALFFRDPAMSQKLQDRAPLVQDAILSYAQALPPALFVEPNQLTLKDGLTAAIIAKVPEFPPDAVLIPEMEAGAGEAGEPTKSP